MGVRAMPWFKVDDGLHSHSKVDDAGVDAIGLWTLAGSWAADQLTDGWVPRARVMRIDPENGLERAARLVAAGFWHVAPGCACIPADSPLREGRDGWHFHDWAERQPSRTDVIQRREGNARRQREWRERKAKERGNGAANAPRPADNAARTRAPTRPDPTTTRSVVVGGASARDDLDAPERRGHTPHAKRMISEIRERLKNPHRVFDDSNDASNNSATAAQHGSDNGDSHFSERSNGRTSADRQPVGGDQAGDDLQGVPARDSAEAGEGMAD